MDANINKLTVSCISDTHGQHLGIEIPRCDVLAVAGDFCNSGSIADLSKFINWCEAQPAKYKVVVAGNHDIVCQEQPALAERMFKDAGIIYLCDSSVTIEGKVIHGSPWTPTYYNWAFMSNEAKLGKQFMKMPDNLDLLITHGGPKGYLDKLGTRNCGSTSLLKTLGYKYAKKMIYGHIHNAHGSTKIDILERQISKGAAPLFRKVAHTVEAYNVSICNDDYELQWEPTLIKI